MADGACYEIWCLVHSGDTRAQGRQACQGVRGLPPLTALHCISFSTFLHPISYGQTTKNVWSLTNSWLCILGEAYCQYCDRINTNVFSFDGISVTVKKIHIRKKILNVIFKIISWWVWSILRCSESSIDWYEDGFEWLLLSSFRTITY